MTKKEILSKIDTKHKILTQAREILTRVKEGRWLEPEEYREVVAGLVEEANKAIKKEYRRVKAHQDTAKNTRYKGGDMRYCWSTYQTIHSPTPLSYYSWRERKIEDITERCESRTLQRQIIDENSPVYKDPVYQAIMKLRERYRGYLPESLEKKLSGIRLWLECANSECPHNNGSTEKDYKGILTVTEPELKKAHEQIKKRHPFGESPLDKLMNTDRTPTNPVEERPRILYGENDDYKTEMEKLRTQFSEPRTFWEWDQAFELKMLPKQEIKKRYQKQTTRTGGRPPY